MALGNTDELVRSLKALPVAAILTELVTRTFIAANDRAGEVFGSPADNLVGSDVLMRIHPDNREAARAGYAAMAGKVIDGYQVQRRIVRPDGTELIVSVSGRRVGDPTNLFGLWSLVPESEPPNPVETLVIGVPAIVLAVTDHDWQIEYVSSDAGLLGARGSELRGFPLIGLIHPSAATEFLAAAARTVTDLLAVTVVTRMRAGRDRWADRYCVMLRICEHQPPRLGVVISAGPTAATLDGPENQLNEYVRQAALEARAVRTLDALLWLDSPMGANSRLARPRLWLGWWPASALPTSLGRCSLVRALSGTTLPLSTGSSACTPRLNCLPLFCEPSPITTEDTAVRRGNTVRHQPQGTGGRARHAVQLISAQDAASIKTPHLVASARRGLRAAPHRRQAMIPTSIRRAARLR